MLHRLNNIMCLCLLISSANFSCSVSMLIIIKLGNPDRKKYSLLKDKYFCEGSRIRYFRSKSLNMRSECENVKECNKNLGAILNICGQLIMTP